MAMPESTPLFMRGWGFSLGSAGCVPGRGKWRRKGRGRQLPCRRGRRGYLKVTAFVTHARPCRVCGETWTVNKECGRVEGVRFVEAHA